MEDDLLAEYNLDYRQAQPNRFIVSQDLRSKHIFLHKTRVNNEDDALRNSLRAALQRNPTYAQNVGFQERSTFRVRWAELLRDISYQYSSQVDDESHLQNISNICDVMTREFGPILHGQRFRLGTSQKALNLYLKFLWCLGLNMTPPPHCPIDRIVLRVARIEGAWTQMDSREVYIQWVNSLREFARANGHQNLQEWELVIW
jgi:hypothetical protein